MLIFNKKVNSNDPNDNGYAVNVNGKVQLLIGIMQLLIQNRRFCNKLIPNDPKVNGYTLMTKIQLLMSTM